MRRLYIHQLPEWPLFRWDDSALLGPIAEARLMQGCLLGQMEGLGFELQNEASLESLTTEIVTSSSIEGESLSRVMVRSSVARRLGMEQVGHLPSERQVEGLTEVGIDATHHFEAPVSSERLLAWHAAMFTTSRSGMSRIRAGAYRDDQGGPMQVVSGRHGRETVHFEAPSAQRVPVEMDRFLAWLEGDDRLDAVLKAGVAHLWFLTIHPFDDGNGRLARQLTELLLARSEKSSMRYYSLSAQIREEREDYYAVLEATQSGTLDITDWLLWFVRCFQRALSSSDSTLATVTRRATFWKRAHRHSLTERQKRVLARLTEGFEGKLTSSKWAKLGKCSPDTALRDMTALVEAGLLFKDPGRGRSTSYSLDW